MLETNPTTQALLVPSAEAQLHQDAKERQAKVEAFLLRDYELKIDNLTSHYTRMWNRFNYFIGIETALAGGQFLISPGRLSAALAFAGVILSGVWYIMGAEDRLLVEVYRKHIKEAAELVAGAVWSDDPQRAASYRRVGEVEQTAREVPETILQWRRRPISTTRWVAILPLILLVLWLVVLWLMFLGVTLI